MRIRRNLDQLSMKRAVDPNNPKWYYGLDKPPREQVVNRFARVLYHVTPAKNLTSIRKYGLMPGKSSTFKNYIDVPEVSTRIYLTDKDGAGFLVDVFLSSSPEGTQVALLRVTLPPGIIVYKEVPSTDPTYAVYVKNRIPPQYIKVVEVLGS